MNTYLCPRTFAGSGMPTSDAQYVAASLAEAIAKRDRQAKRDRDREYGYVYDPYTKESEEAEPMR